MKVRHAITRFAAMAIVAAGSIQAGAAFAEDKMKADAKTENHMKGDSMKGDHMKGDAMKGDHKQGDAMKGDAMKSGEKSSY
jgi:pentapeptide MXKDX repeat protein